MNNFPLTTIINFCTHDLRFLSACIEQCRLFSKQILLPICDHFFDGTAEDLSLVAQLMSAFPDCQFIVYPFIPDNIPKRLLRNITPAHFWHCASRLIATSFLEKEIDLVLFLDTDEIPEGEKMAAWLQTGAVAHHEVLKLATYWYFREPCYQATSWEDSIVLAKRSALRRSLLLHKQERDAIYDILTGPKKRMVLGLDGMPFFHHYSWVRTEEEMKKKVSRWGHREDRNWTALVEKEFTHPFQGTDFIHGYSYRECIPPFPLSPPSVSTPSQHTKKGTVLSTQEFLRLIAPSWWQKIFSLEENRFSLR